MTKSILTDVILMTFAIFPLLLAAFVPVMTGLRNKQKIDLFQPPLMLVGILLLGTTLRTAFLLFDDNSNDRWYVLVSTYAPRDIIANGLIAINIGVISWLFGYYYTVRDFKLFRSSQKVFSPASFQRTLWVILGISAILVAFYLQRINFFSSISSFGLSAKRFATIGNSETRTNFTYFKMASDFLSVCTIVFYAQAILRGMAPRKRAAITFGMFLLAIAVPFIASTRGEIIYLVLSIFIVRHYLLARINGRQIMLFIAGMLVLVAYMGTLRSQSYARLAEEDSSQFHFDITDLTEIMHPFVYSAQLVGVGKTSVIVERMPREVPLLWGKSYLATAIAPIPRTLWPAKPVVRIGLFVGMELFRFPFRSGAPPGVIGEAYMNFWWPGIVIICGLFGFFCRMVYSGLVKNPAKRTPFGVALYAILWIFIFDVWSTDFTGNIMRIMRYLVPFAIFWYCSYRMPQRRVSLGTSMTPQRG